MPVPLPAPGRHRHHRSRSRALIDFGWIKLTGWIGWWTWGLAHIYFLIGLKNRIFIALNWLWIYSHRLSQRPADHARDPVPTGAAKP